MILPPPLSNALDMTTQWHIPRALKNNPIQIDSKPLHLQIEQKIKIFESQKRTVKPQFTLSPFDRMQMAFIQARILARKGQYPEAIKIYEQLRLSYPESLDIQADYADVLLEYGDYENAAMCIKHLLKKKSFQTRGLQMMASMYDRLDLPTWTFPIYENILNQQPNNDVIWMDYANQRSKAGHWQKSLNAYSRVLEKDPENIYALRGVHQILREKRPALNAQFLQYSGSDDTVRYHQHYNWRYILTETLLFRTHFERIDIKIPDNIQIQSQNIQQTTLELNLDIFPYTQFIGRLFCFSGPVDDISMYGAVKYRLLSDSVIQIAYQGTSSWFDPIQAMDQNGSFEEYQLSFATPLFEQFRLNALLAFRKYSLDFIDDYGDRSGIHMDLSRRILSKPDTTLIFALDQGRFAYHTDNEDVPMVLEENAFSCSTYIQDQPFGRLYYFLSSGFRWDRRRSLFGFFLNPGFGWHFTSQFQMDLSYSYSSESTGVIQGSTQTYHMNGNLIF
jgi:hypothetical protein